VQPGNDKDVRALLYRLGPQHFVDRVLVAWSRSWSKSSRAVQDAAWRASATLAERWAVPVFPLKAADFIKRGVPAGPALGAALHEAEEAWIAADFPADAAAVAAIADAATTEVRPM
jgi:poly(A) polymerase